MSVRPGEWPEVPEETARMARASFPKGSLAMRVRDELGSWCEDADFGGLYGARGRPGLSPAQLMTVTVLQFTENLTDRQAADAVRGRIDWKYCLGLEMTDPGFDFSVLSEFRARLAEGDAGRRRPLDLLLRRLKEAGLVKAGTRQRTDSTHVLARVRDLNRLELAGESVRAAVEALAAAEPAWLAGIIDTSWQKAYGQKICQMRLPGSAAARERLAVQYARDGYFLLEQVSGPGAPPAAGDLPAVRALRVVLLQQFYRESGPGGGKVTWRDGSEQGLPPGRDRIVSPYDPDARYGEKRDTRWLGYKAHFSETVSDPGRDDPAAGTPEFPNLVTCTATTHASVPDMVMTQVIHDLQEQAGLAPCEHLADSGYASAAHLIASRDRGITLTGPLKDGVSWQERTGGYTTPMFAINWEDRQVTCPEGRTSTSWNPSVKNGAEAIVVKFSPVTCRDCPVRDKCTRSARSGRQLTLRPREVHEAVAAARAEQGTREWQARYGARAGVEGLMRQASHVTGIRRARYLGLARTSLEHSIAAAALNLIRLDDWWTGSPPDRGHVSHLQELDLAA
ncbi:MAG: IS1182 family transposase [Nocardiopsaceae bacterium]|nr:IS1182 family transposase [Nocardiopsaceae bacterium]